MSSRDFRIFTFSASPLAAAVVWLSLRENDRSDSRAMALTARVAALESKLRYLPQLQAQLDELRRFHAFGDPIARRVTPRCAGVLKPRYGG